MASSVRSENPSFSASLAFNHVSLSYSAHSFSSGRLVRFFQTSISTCLILSKWSATPLNLLASPFVSVWGLCIINCEAVFMTISSHAPNTKVPMEAQRLSTYPIIFFPVFALKFINVLYMLKPSNTSPPGVWKWIFITSASALSAKSDRNLSVETSPFSLPIPL